MAPVEVLSQATRRNNVQSFIEPTIFVGLGGTGKEVLLRIRRRFFEKFGVIGYPIIGYLWIDTDMQNQNLDGQMLDDHIAEEVRFRAEEYIDAQVPAQHFMAYFENPIAHPNIFSWMYPQLAGLGAVMNGARMVRPLGRLGFFHRFTTIQQRLNELMARIKNNQNRQDAETKYGLQVGGTPKFVIVSSIAGGTGSGMFLDTAFFCRHYFNNPQTDIVGYLLLPTVFAPTVENNEPLYANAYAALKELEFYSMRKDFLASNLKTVRQRHSLEPGGDQQKTVSAHDFEVDWTNSRDLLKIPGPPFNTCYLIDNETPGRGQISVEKKGDLCDMIAESIFNDYSSHIFGAHKRSVRSNLDDYLGNELKYDYLNAAGQTIHTEVFSCRFSAMGFSKIFVPADRIRKACAYTFASDLLAEFLRSNAAPGDPARLLKENDLPELKLRLTDFSVLERENDSGGTFNAAITKFWTEDIVQQLLSEAEAKDPDLPRKFQTEIDNYSRLRFAEPPEREKWGTFIRRLQLENQPSFIKDSQNRILERAKVWLDSPKIRIDLAIAYLQELNNYLEKLGKDFRDRTEAARQSEKNLSQDVRTLSNYMHDEKNGLWVHRRALKALVEQACSSAAEMFRSRTKAKVFSAAEQVCRTLQEYIGSETYTKLPDGTQVVERAGLIQTLAGLRDELSKVRAETEHKLASFEKASEHLIFENLYRPGMFREYYRIKPHDEHAEWKEVDLHGDEEQLRDEEFNFRRFARISSLYDLLEQFQTFGPKRIERTFTDYAETRFRDLDVNADALKIFFERYERENRVGERVIRFVQNGSPWVVPSAIAACVNAVRQNYEEAVELGLSQTASAHERYQNFYEQIRNQISVRLPKTQLGAPIALEPNNIALYTEMAGIPLLFINRLREYEQAYSAQLRNQKPMHLTRADDRFADILPKTQEQIESTIRINEVLLVGTILHTLEVSPPQDGQVLYSFRNDDSTPPRMIPLGRYHMAVETLRGNQEYLSILTRKTNQLRDKLTLASCQQFLAVLVSQIEDGTTRIPGKVDAYGEPACIPEGPFPPRYLTVGSRTVEHQSAEHQALLRVIAQERERLIRKMNLDPADINSLILERYATLDEFSEMVPIGKVSIRRLKNPDARQTAFSGAGSASVGVAAAAAPASAPTAAPAPNRGPASPPPIRESGSEDIM